MFRKVLIALAVGTAIAVPAVAASPASASTCNSTQCYWSVHIGSDDGSPWLSNWETDWLNSNAYSELVNSYGPPVYGGYWHGGVIEPINCVVQRAVRTTRPTRSTWAEITG